MPPPGDGANALDTELREMQRLASERQRAIDALAGSGSDASAQLEHLQAALRRAEADLLPSHPRQ